jgi:plasmid replication initiation protein
MKIVEQTKSITQDNALIEACYSMTLNEKRLLMLGLSKVDPTKFPDIAEQLQFKLTASDWLKAYPESKQPYIDMKRAADSLLSRYLTLHPKTGQTERINWFSRVKYIDQGASVEVEFTPPIKVRVMGLLENFTTIPLLEVGRLKSMYGIRLYELLQQFKHTGARLVTLEDFRIAMDCVDRYPLTKDLKRRILAPALHDLAKNNEMIVNAQDIKKGRKITGFKFVFEKQNRLF